MTPRSLPPDGLGDVEVNDLTPEQVRELAAAYVDLLGSMTWALRECETGYGFFCWRENGFDITGHPPEELVRQIKEAT